MANGTSVEDGSGETQTRVFLSSVLGRDKPLNFVKHVIA